MTSIVTFLLWMAALWQSPPSIQGPRTQLRTSISGTTVSSEQSDPLPFVTVTLRPVNNGSSQTPLLTNLGRGGNGDAGFQATSDATGQFVFPAVPPGSYSLSAERGGFMRMDRFQLPGQAIQSILSVIAERKVAGLVVTMTPAPAISGAVYGADAKPLAGASIDAYRVQYTPYGRQLSRVVTVLSHEGGDYRLFQLSPGHYYVGARYSDPALRPWKSLLQISRNLPDPDEGYSTVYFPDEMRIDDAKVVNLQDTRAASNIDIFFKENRYFRLSIKLMRPALQPLPGVPLGGRPLVNPRVALFPAGVALGTALDYQVVGNGSRYTVDRLPEGDYVLVAFADFQDASGRNHSEAVSDTQFLRVTDNTEATIAAMDPLEISGTVGGAVAPAGSAMQVELARVDPLTSQSIVAYVDGAGHFSLTSVSPGLYDVFLKGQRRGYIQTAGFPYSSDRQSMQIRVDASLPPRSWVCDTPECQNSHLISDAPLVITASSLDGSTRGQVTERDGKASADATVVLTPNDMLGRLRKDRYGVATTDASGAFQIQGLPPGGYTAFAFERLEPQIYFDRDFNLQIAAKGTPLELSANSGGTLKLTLISAEELASLTR